MRRERRKLIFGAPFASRFARARVCISPAPQLETTSSLSLSIYINYLTGLAEAE